MPNIFNKNLTMKVSIVGYDYEIQNLIALI